jgi:hypothetical protein
MFNATKPDASELPSSSQLLKSTGIAAVVAGALLVMVVLPAEYGVDPIGTGSLLGLTEMGRVKMQLASEAAADAAADFALPVPEASAPVRENLPPPTQPTASATAPPAAVATPPAQAATPAAPSTAVAIDESVVTLGPDEGFEIKLVMEKGAKATYEWFTDGPGVNYDTHADGEGIKYHGYGKGTDTPRQSGELVAAFKGQHGWFWRNRTDEDVTITLRTSGEYTDLKQYD